ncbi:MAG TPA: hypothetical protein VNZ67_00090 [bacterium]|nr:hypothetical protein [bacterium]
MLVWPAFAPAQEDWLNLQVPDPMPGRRFEVAGQILSGESDLWANGAFQTDYSRNTDLVVPNGGTPTVSVKELAMEVELRGRVWRNVIVEADLPLVLTEVSAAVALAGTSYPPDSPNALRGGGLGDIRLGLRGPWLGAAPGPQLGWSLGLIAPTGQGPFDSTTPLAATGDGRWQVQPGLVCGGGGDGDLEAWIQVQGRWQFGREAWVSSLAPLGYTGTVQNSTYVTAKTSGAVWLNPRWGGDAAAGLGWNWYRDADQRHTLAVELLGHWLSPWVIDGVDQGLVDDGTEDECSVQVEPELQAHFGAFTAVGGWRSAVLYGTGVPDPYWGQLIFNASYAF